MKYLLFSLLVLLMACNKDDMPVSGEEEAAVTQSQCMKDPFQFTMEVDGITVESDSCWLLYLEDPAGNGIIQPEYSAVIKYRLPGYPEWDGANSIDFRYVGNQLESNKTYPVGFITGVIQFNGSDGLMISGLGDQSMDVNVVDFDEELGYICGDFSGKAMIFDTDVVDVSGSFKGFLNP